MDLPYPIAVGPDVRPITLDEPALADDPYQTILGRWWGRFPSSTTQAGNAAMAWFRVLPSEPAMACGGR